MKTLDEVIEELQCWDTCGKYPECFYDDEVTRDALYYLKTIETTENLYHDAVNELSKRKEEDWKDRYLPLTWSELRQMEGKPVWVEDEDCYSRWEIINGVYDNGISFGDYFLNENEFGIVWQAYRKEKNKDT